ncbi:MAG: glutamine--tRNA ligase [Acidimicrobiaceae bacterium]|nr:glutamine--tRNA ligase [Acidimicrobiaceae bacterium]OUV00665.1 MAG: glutamine--tRNA ligase [Acidimicrobiaceae bacterium TMED77]|tara:strand:+ start:12178 stop:13872 length:1695 start_codon:yes stop_codon:yes gene_type:complete
MNNNDTDEAPKQDFIRVLVNDDIASNRFSGNVQTRFPPEPNGHLHVGHAKSICLNYGLASEFSGACNLRFDDTNPTTENKEYAESIRQDIEWLLGEKLSMEPVFASNYFDQLYEWAELLIESGKAYVDDQDADSISKQRGSFTEAGMNSPFRDRTPEENLTLFRNMRLGKFADGECVLRARISMSHENMNMRDPVLYRIRNESHFRTGNTWVVYPTYDWAHGQSDAIEGVTHSLCTLEFESHRPLYDWFLEQLDIPTNKRPYQTEFARLNFTHTVLSKRLLRRLVEESVVEGWDDPRMPTLSGLRKRGYPPSAIRAFCDHIGIAKTNSTHEIELLESFVRSELNQTANRRMVVLNPLKLTITNWPKGKVEYRSASNNPNDPSQGSRMVPFSGELYIERDDFMEDPPKKFFRLSIGREVRLRFGYYVTCNEVIKDEQGNPIELLCTYDPETSGGKAPDGRKVKATLHWVEASNCLDGTAITYDRLFRSEHPDTSSDVFQDLNQTSLTRFTSAKFEPSINELEDGDVIQFERLGYFCKDGEAENLFHRTVGLRDEWANIQKRKNAN